ncbi:CAP domain-containing protein [Streptomyces zaomyceticus]|uniref:CAP domain-containing protein n=1 Tax=Streptomyces zaomyceticus TaxID=68286 RepID=UPI0037180FC6
MRHDDRPGHHERPDRPERPAHPEHAGRPDHLERPLRPVHPIHPDGPVRDFSRESAGAGAPAASAGGRHRKGGGVRRRRPRRPSFRTAVTAAGAAAAVLTVATGVYVASFPAVGPGTGATAAAAAARVAAAPAPRASGTFPAARAALTGARPKAESERHQAPEPEQQLPGQAREPGQNQERGVRQPGTASGAQASAGDVVGFAQDVVALANAEREKAGCGRLRSESHLRAAAQKHADDMSARDYYEHDSPEGHDAGDRMSGAGYAWSTWGENIHRGPRTPARAMADWMNSPGHRANILNCSFEDIGVGVTLTSNGPWWVQNFGVKR